MLGGAPRIINLSNSILMAFLQLRVRQVDMSKGRLLQASASSFKATPILQAEALPLRYDLQQAT